MLFLEVEEAPPDRLGLIADGLEVGARCPVRGQGVPAGLEDEDRSEGRELRLIESVPQSGADRQRHQQIAFSVDPTQHRRMLGVETETAQHILNSFEDESDRGGATFDTGDERVVLSDEFVRPVGPAGVELPVRAVVAGVCPHLRLEFGHSGALTLMLSLRFPVGLGIDPAVVNGGFEDGQQLPAITCLPVVELLRHPDSPLSGNGLGHLVRAQVPHFALLGEDGGELGDTVLVAHRGDDDRATADAFGRHRHHIADLERGEGFDDIALFVPRLRPGLLLLRVRDRPTQSGVFGEVTEIAVHRLLVRLDRGFVLAHLARQPDDGLIGLELGERGLEHLRGFVRAHPRQQIRRHVVGRSERRVECVGAVRSQRGQFADLDGRVPHHDRMADAVDSAATGASGQLRVLPRGDHHMRFAVELHELLEHDGASGHVDAQRQGLRGEDDLDDSLREQLFDELFELRNHPRVVRGDSEQQSLAKGVIAEDAEVFVGEFIAQRFQCRVDDRLLFPRVQVGACAQVLFDGFVAAVAGEDEHDRRQHRRLGEGRHDLGATGPAEPCSGGTCALRARSSVRARGMVEGRIDAVGIAVREQVVHPVADQDVVDQRHRPVARRHDRRRSSDLTQPGPEFLDVGHRRRQRHHLHSVRQVDDDLFPDRAAEPVGEVVDFVEDDEAEVRQSRHVVVEHIAQHFGGHDDDRRITSDRCVTGEEPDVLGPMDLGQVVELLVAQRLDRGGVEDPFALTACQLHGKFRDERLACSGRRRDQHVLALLQMPAGLDLEVVEGELGAFHELSQGSAGELRTGLEVGIGGRGTQWFLRRSVGRKRCGISHSSLRRSVRPRRPTGPVR